MELKKNPSISIEKRKNFFFIMGLCIALSSSLVAFEWKTFESKISELGSLDVVFDETEMIPIVILEKPIPKLPKPKIEIISTEKIVDEIHTLEINPDPRELLPEIDFTEVNFFNEEPIDEIEIPLLGAERMPEFPGGEKAMHEYLRKNIRYPREALNAGISGIVYIGFTVNKDGSLSDIEIKQGIGHGCDLIAMNAVKKMPTWIPGMQRNKPVRVSMNIPIKFTSRP